MRSSNVLALALRLAACAGAAFASLVADLPEPLAPLPPSPVAFGLALFKP